MAFISETASSIQKGFTQGLCAHTKKVSQQGKPEMTKCTWEIWLLRIAKARVENPQGLPDTKQQGNKTAEETEQC